MDGKKQGVRVSGYFNKKGTSTMKIKVGCITFKLGEIIDYSMKTQRRKQETTIKYGKEKIQNKTSYIIYHNKCKRIKPTHQEAENLYLNYKQANQINPKFPDAAVYS